MEATPVIFTFDRKYFIPGMVAIKSLVDNLSDKSRIEIFVLHKNLSENLISIAKALVDSYGSIVTFIDLSGVADGIDCRADVSEQLFYNLYVPQYFKSYDNKLVILDADTLVRDDILKIIDELPNDKKMGGVRCVYRQYTKHGDFGNFRQVSAGNGIKDVDGYINSGLVVFNNGLITDSEREQCVSLIEKKWHSNDEMILNYVFQDSVYHYSQRWNFQMELEHEPLNFFSELIRKDMEESRSNIAICHFLGHAKPWRNFHFSEDCQIFLDEYKQHTRQIMHDIDRLAAKIACGSMWKIMGVL